MVVERMLRVNNILIKTMITDFSKGYEKLLPLSLVLKQYQSRDICTQAFVQSYFFLGMSGLRILWGIFILIFVNVISFVFQI